MTNGRGSGIIIPGPGGPYPDGMVPPGFQQAPQQQAPPPSPQDIANRLVRDIASEGGADFIGLLEKIEAWKQANPEETKDLEPGQVRTLLRLQLVAVFQRQARDLEDIFRTGKGSGSQVVQSDGDPYGTDEPKGGPAPGDDDSSEAPMPQVTD